ncbi:MAG TPA: hypothetical protein VH330_12385 [Candidatus Udaeobacter sp.]
MRHVLAIEVVLSSVGVFSFPRAGAPRIHFWSMLFSAIPLIRGVVLYGKLLRAQTVAVLSHFESATQNPPVQ